MNAPNKKASRIRAPLLLFILLCSLMPTLVLVQRWVAPKAPSTPQLSGTLQISVEGQAPFILPITLFESTQNPPQLGLSLQGQGALQEGTYPWNTLPFEGTFSLRLNLESQAPAASEFKMEWAASYSERLLSRPDGLGLAPLPCKGSIQRVNSEKSKDPNLQGLSAYSKLQLALDLNCTSAGADLLWSSGDEKVWTIKGPLGIR
jgi:hypothetical protein